VLFSTLAFSADMSDAGVMGVKGSGMRLLARDGPWIEIDPRVAPLAGELVFEKLAASCFFGTGLDTRLRALGVDTLVVTGCTTSGCVRATVVDASSHGFRTIVVEEAVGDRAVVPHFVSLFDMDAKYGDVVPADQATAYLRDPSAGSAA
jgi:nicotinamidase-related amidase